MPRKGSLASFSSSFSTADALWDKYVDISAEKDGSIMKRLVKRGDAKLGYPLKRDRVRVSWELETEEGEFIHDSADYEDSEGDYYDFQVGMQPCEVLKGMDLAVQSMFQGEVASFLLTSSLGFGAEGFEDIVPPNTSLRLLLSLRKIEYSLERTYGRGDPSETAEERLQKQLAEVGRPVTLVFRLRVWCKKRYLFVLLIPPKRAVLEVNVTERDTRIYATSHTLVCLISHCAMC
jgi:hypothetical protein